MAASVQSASHLDLDRKARRRLFGLAVYHSGFLRKEQASIMCLANCKFSFYSISSRFTCSKTSSQLVHHSFAQVPSYPIRRRLGADTPS